MIEKKISAKPQFYAFFFEEMKAIAQKYGYNLCLHGSLVRDMDLVAIPWVDHACDPLTLIQSLDDFLTGDHFNTEEEYLHSVLGAGRRGFVINLNRGEMLEVFTGRNDPKWYLDISVTPLVINP